MRLAPLAFAVLGLAGAAPPAAGDLADVKKAGTLRVLVHPDVRRPEFYAPGNADRPGFDHEVLEGFAGVQRVKLEIVKAPAWDALVPALLEKKGDVIAGRFTSTDSRRKVISFTSESFPYRLVVITRKPARVITTLADLRNEKIGTTKGTSMAEAILSAGIPASSLDEGIPTGGYVDALKSGRVSAAVWGVESAVASQREDPDLQLGMFLGPPGSLAYGVRKEDGALRDALSQYVDGLRRTPTWSRLVVKYFGEKAPEILKKARAEP